jgi:hypothetical protein
MWYRKENLLVNLESQKLIEDTLEKTKNVMETQSIIQKELSETKELSEEANQHLLKQLSLS